MWDPAKVVPGTIMPAYRWMFVNNTDVDTAYAEMLTVEEYFGVPYNKPVPMKDGSTKTIKMGATLNEARKMALEEAKLIAADMKNQDVKDAVELGRIPEIVALIAYMNSLK